MTVQLGCLNIGAVPLGIRFLMLALRGDILCTQTLAPGHRGFHRLEDLAIPTGAPGMNRMGESGDTLIAVLRSHQ